MRMIILSAAALVGTCVVSYYVGAQPAIPTPAYSQPHNVPPVFAPPYVASAQAYGTPGTPVMATWVPSRSMPMSNGELKSSVVEIAREYGKTLDAAVRDNIISNDVGKQLAAEIGFMLSVKRVRIDLNRAANTLVELEREGKGLPGWEEAHELREMLPKLESLKLKVEAPTTGVNGNIGTDR